MTPEARDNLDQQLARNIAQLDELSDKILIVTAAIRKIDEEAATDIVLAMEDAIRDAVARLRAAHEEAIAP